MLRCMCWTVVVDAEMNVLDQCSATGGSRPSRWVARPLEVGRETFLATQ